jgi:hypothetical protein
MRVCEFCGESIEGRRPQARFCSGSCRAAASRQRAAERAADGHPTRRPSGTEETAQKAHTRTETTDEFRPATPSEEARALRLIRDHADLFSEAA